MLTIQVKVNGRLVAEAQVHNVSDEADVSDYSVVWRQQLNENLLITERMDRLYVRGHRRRQSAWCLVAKVVSGILGQLAGSQPDGWRDDRPGS